MARAVLAAVFGAELLIYATGFFFYRHLPEAVVRFLFMAGTSWMLFTMYCGGCYLIIDLACGIWRKTTGRPWQFWKRSTRFRIATFIIPMVFVIGVMGYGRYQFMHPVVQQVPIAVDKPAGKMDSIRIATIGDVHMGYMIDRAHTKRFVDLIMAQKPDLILFVGDIIDAQIEPVLRQQMDKELLRLHAPLGVFSCTGNHEYRYDAEEKIALLNKSGITMLRDSAVLIDSSFYVVGREDKITPTRKPLRKILEDQAVDLSKPVIVLNHTPNNLAEEADAGADIALYGHTHHGQAFPGNLATELVFEVAHGYKKKNNTHVYVSSGIGLVGPQYRIGSVSEIVMLSVQFRH